MEKSKLKLSVAGAIVSVGLIAYGLGAFKSNQLNCDSKEAQELIMGIAQDQGIRVTSLQGFREISGDNTSTECTAGYTVEGMTGSKVVEYSVYLDTEGVLNVNTKDSK